jgi:hypothetical protein
MDRLLVKIGKNYEIWGAICQQIKTHLRGVKATIGKLGGFDFHILKVVGVCYSFLLTYIKI